MSGTAALSSPPATADERVGADGLATLGPAAVALRDLLERRFLAWAAEIGAPAVLYPPMLRSRDLERLDYFRNFPHLAVATCRIRSERLDEYASGAPAGSIPASHLTDSEYVLPSAACFNVYLHLAGQVLEEPRTVTTVATCFRNEEAYRGLERLWSFTMREIVCLGPAAAVEDHLSSFRRRILELVDELGLEVETAVASDPFFQPQSSRAVMQQLFPQKEELVYGGSLAIGSLNFHRNFFGERCDIRTADGEHVYTGCVAFGIERWLHALLDHHDGDAAAATAALGAVVERAESLPAGAGRPGGHA